MDAALFRHRIIAPLLLLLLTGACASTKPRPDAQEVKDLKIEGTDQVDDGDIKAKILTADTPWWEPLWPFDKGPAYFDPNAWQADLRRIERYYQAEGYYQAQVVSNEVKPEGKEAVSLVATVREGEPTRIAEVKLSGMEELPEDHQRRARAELPLTPGEIFREENWEGVKDLIQGRLRELGYAEAEVGGEVRVDVDTHQATVDLQVKPGPRYKFGNIFVAADNAPQVAPRRIIEQAQGSVRKGEWFSETALADAQARVFAMGVFGAVKVSRGGPDREAGTVPVIVDVREAPLRSVRLGGGLGVDATRQEGRLLGEWTNRNIFGGLRRLTVRGRVGYAFLPSFYAAGTGGEEVKSGIIFDATTEFEQPRFVFRDLRLQASLSGEKGIEQAYDFLGGRLRTGVIWQPHPDLSVFPAYNLERYRLTGKVSVNQDVPPITLGCDPTEPACDIALSYLETTVTWDRRDSPLDPRNGYYASLSIQGGGGPLFGDFTYVRLLPDLRYYRTFGLEQRLTIAGKLRLGTLRPFSSKFEDENGAQSSIVTRFFSGGGSSMRGFNSRRLSPQVPIVTRAEDPRLPTPAPAQFITVPVGGNSLLETSLEVRYRITENIVVASFWDTGYVGCNGESAECYNPFRNQPFHALGMGLRYLTVVGPLRVDIARRLNIGRPLLEQAGGYTYPGGTCFGLGSKKQQYAGAPEGLCTFQLSIGEAF